MLLNCAAHMQLVHVVAPSVFCLAAYSYLLASHHDTCTGMSVTRVMSFCMCSGRILGRCSLHTGVAMPGVCYIQHLMQGTNEHTTRLGLAN